MKFFPILAHVRIVFLCVNVIDKEDFTQKDQPTKLLDEEVDPSDFVFNRNTFTDSFQPTHKLKNTTPSPQTSPEQQQQQFTNDLELIEEENPMESQEKLKIQDLAREIP